LAAAIGGWAVDFVENGLHGVWGDEGGTYAEKGEGEWPASTFVDDVSNDKSCSSA